MTSFNPYNVIKCHSHYESCSYHYNILWLLCFNLIDQKSIFLSFIREEWYFLRTISTVDHGRAHLSGSSAPGEGIHFLKAEVLMLEKYFFFHKNTLRHHWYLWFGSIVKYKNNILTSRVFFIKMYFNQIVFLLKCLFINMPFHQNCVGLNS